MRLTKTITRNLLALAILTIFSIPNSIAINRISIASGSWNASATWSPSGSPSPTDNITIATGHTITVGTNQTVHHLTINQGGKLTWNTSSTLSVTGNIIVNGTVLMNGGNISLTNYGLAFNIGATGSFTWDPGTNSVAAATLFTNGIEAFAPTSTLIIKKWYNYAVPLTSVVSGNFGNLELNTFNGTTIPEWNQNNGFQTHQIPGTLTVDAGWITLDKSGSISNSTIGKVILKNVNSSLYIHNGTHPSSFNFTTSSVTNNGGTFYGINDGNGNINLHVTGNFTNYGNVKVINNSGIAGISNGNATFTVDSAYNQTGGDTRIIYNVSTTNSGLFTAGFRDINLTGGIFMGQSGVRTSGGTCTMNVSQNLTINFSNSADKFRGASMSSIGASINKVQFNLTVGGNLSITGVLNAEVTSSAAAGTENVTVTGTSSISGCTTSFNYGALSASHGNTLTMSGNVSITGGILFLSRNNGPSTINFNGNMDLSAGQVTLKGGDSTAAMTIAGNYTQTSGQFYIHNNSASPSTVSSTVTVLNNYSQTSGTFSFDSNPSNASANHQLKISGANFNIGGNSIIMRAGAGTCSSFGIINYKRTGIINYNRSSSSVTLSQVKQLISIQSTLNVAGGNFLVSSTPTLVNDMAKVDKGAILNLTGNKIESNNTYPFSTINVDSNATLALSRAQGLYDGTTSGCMTPGITFNLHANSIVEYNGGSNQTLTGNLAGLLPVSNQYGILKINMQGTARAILNNTVIVRTKLILTNGALDLAGNSLTIGSGSPSAITRTNGYINGELAGGLTAGTVIWKNMNFGLHEFPFGTSASAYLPVRLFFLAGVATDVSASTYAAPTTDNQPLPLFNGTPVNFNIATKSFPATDIIDRWWVINAPGVMAGLTVSYEGSENTIDAGYQAGQIGFLSWTGSTWTAPSSSGTGVISGIGIVSTEEISNLSVLTVGHQGSLRTASNIRALMAEQTGDEASITWKTEQEQNSDYFIVERSTDGNNFEEIARKKAVGTSNSVLNYSAIDPKPIEGKSFYRIRHVSTDRSSLNSSVAELTFSSGTQTGVSIESIGPNPFESSFNVNYKVNADGVVRFELSGSNGQMIHQSEVYDSQGSHTFNFSEGSRLQSGIYFLKVTSDGKSVTKKLVRK
ncbi:MAG: T9SS type A sorting domain-containing protein [Bacteroidetes bacterium]|nr:T9SS type A sorting domain-containing protein [Bacteroidota bacterium]